MSNFSGAAYISSDYTELFFKGLVVSQNVTKYTV